MYSLLDRYFGGILKRYVLLIVIGAPISVIFCFVVLPQFSDKPDNTETEKVYKVPERSEQERGEVSLTDAPSSQHEAQGESPPLPKKNPDLEKHRRLQEISVQLEQEQDQAIEDPAKALWMLNLLEEMIKLQQALGILHTDGSDPLLPIRLGKLVASNMTSDKRLPVSVGEEVVDLLVESGDIDSAATTYMAMQRAIENGDEFFLPEHWTAEQDFSEDLCCPEETAQALLEAGHEHVQTTGKTPAPSTSQKLSPERFSKARQFIDEYGTEEGLHRLRESDPDAARQLEQGRDAPSRWNWDSEQRSRSEPSRDASADDAYSDDEPSDDSP